MLRPLSGARFTPRNLRDTWSFTTLRLRFGISWSERKTGGNYFTRDADLSEVSSPEEVLRAETIPTFLGLSHISTRTVKLKMPKRAEKYFPVPKELPVANIVRSRQPAVSD
jgi:hypothetical protein